MAEKSKPGSLSRRTQRKGWLFLSPFLIGFTCYFCVVVANSLVYSFSSGRLTEQGLVTTFNGFENYIYAFTKDVQFERLLSASIGMFLSNIPVIVIFSLFIAVVLNEKIKGRLFFRAIFFIPVVISTGLVTKIDMSNTFLNEISNTPGIDSGGLMIASQQFLSFESIQKLTLSLHLNSNFTSYIFSAVNNILSIVNQSGVQILIFLCGLQAISPSIYEAAEVEGASSWESFWKITFPMISPMILINIFYSVINYFTNTNSEMMAYLNKIMFSSSLYGEATAMAWIYFVSISVIIAVIALIVNRFVFYQEV